MYAENSIDPDLPQHDDILKDTNDPIKQPIEDIFENTIDPDMPPFEDIFENIIDPDMPPLEDIVDNNVTFDMPSVEKIFDDDMNDNDNILNHESINFVDDAATATTRARETSIDIHNVNSEKDIENIQNPISASSAS